MSGDEANGAHIIEACGLEGDLLIVRQAETLYPYNSRYENNENKREPHLRFSITLVRNGALTVTYTLNAFALRKLEESCGLLLASAATKEALK